MSQSKNRPSQGKGSRQREAGGQGRPAQRGSGSGSARPGVVRQPIATGGSSPSTMRSRVDKVLPPFSLKRYAAIWVGVLVPMVLVLLVLTQCNTPATTTGSEATAGSPIAAATVATQATAATGGGSTSAAGGPGKYMVIDTAKGKIVAKLYTDDASKVTKTVANFVDKANKGYFNGLTFHRVEDWVIQGGDPLGNGTGGGQMPSEYNNISFKAGALGVARGQDPAINNDSQFFIVKTDATYLDGQYTNFGQVTEGMDVVNKIMIGDKINKVTIEDR